MTVSAKPTMEALLRLVVEQGATDLHLSANLPPHLRLDDRLVATDHSPLSGTEIKELAYSLVAPDKVIRSKGSLLEKFIRPAVFEGSRYAVQNPEGAAEILRKRTPDLDAALVKEVMVKLASQRLFGINGGLEPGVTEYTLKLSSDIGLLTRPLRPEDVLDQTFVKKIAAELGPVR